MKKHSTPFFFFDIDFYSRIIYNKVKDLLWRKKMKYVIGIDFGTLSARAVLVNAETGEEIAEKTAVYAHGVMDEKLHTGKALPRDFALQHPTDYLDALRTVTHSVIEGIDPCEVVGLGIDFTSSTVLPIDSQGMPLCYMAEYENEPHAYVKLWKHHGPEKDAERITALANERREEWLSIYGGVVSSEWMMPKILETLRCAPEVYNAAHRFVEAGDWLSLYLTGKETRAASFAGYKMLWNSKTGYPCNEFMTDLDARLSGIIGTKIPERVDIQQSNAGTLNARGAEITGLSEGCVLSLPIIDAHAAMPALNLTRAGDMMMIIGTSSCHIVNSDREVRVEGISGFVKDAVIPGMYTYEAGQTATGDAFDAFVKKFVPTDYVKKAEARNMNIHAYLRELAAPLRPGESGLLALDWFNGNRSILTNFDLSGMILGLNLATKPEQIYRALIEAAVFGTKVIFDQYENNGIPIKRVCAAGGIAMKDEMMMQIYADVLNREIRVVKTAQAAARGDAIYASVAAGVYPSVCEAAERFALPIHKVYTPNAENVKIYAELFREFKALHDYFGKTDGVMVRLKKMRGM